MVTLIVCKHRYIANREIMSEIKFKKPRRKIERKTTAEDSDEDKSDDESLKLVLLVHVTIKTTTVRSCI